MTQISYDSTDQKSVEGLTELYKGTARIMLLWGAPGKNPSPCLFYLPAFLASAPNLSIFRVSSGQTDVLYAATLPVLCSSSKSPAGYSGPNNIIPTASSLAFTVCIIPFSIAITKFYRLGVCKEVCSVHSLEVQPIHDASSGKGLSVTS